MTESPITTIGNLLLLPNLEDETIKAVNQALRQMIGLYIRAKPPENDISETTGIDPFSNARLVVDEAFGPGVFAEWVSGEEVKKDG